MGIPYKIEKTTCTTGCSTAAAGYGPCNNTQIGAVQLQVPQQTFSNNVIVGGYYGAAISNLPTDLKGQGINAFDGNEVVNASNDNFRVDGWYPPAALLTKLTNLNALYAVGGYTMGASSGITLQNVNAFGAQTTGFRVNTAVTAPDTKVNTVSTQYYPLDGLLSAVQLFGGDGNNYGKLTFVDNAPGAFRWSYAALWVDPEAVSGGSKCTTAAASTLSAPDFSNLKQSRTLLFQCPSTLGSKVTFTNYTGPYRDAIAAPTCLNLPAGPITFVARAKPQVGSCPVCDSSTFPLPNGVTAGFGDSCFDPVNCPNLIPPTFTPGVCLSSQ